MWEEGLMLKMFITVIRASTEKKLSLKTCDWCRQEDTFLFTTVPQQQLLSALTHWNELTITYTSAHFSTFSTHFSDFLCRWFKARGECTFAVRAPKLWKDLPKVLKSLFSFKSSLKTPFYRLVYFSYFYVFYVWHLITFYMLHLLDFLSTLQHCFLLVSAFLFL